MKEQEIKKMVQCKAVESVRVMRLANSATGSIDEKSGWSIEFHMSWKMFATVDLETARGDIREFKTLDAVNKFLVGVGVSNFEVISFPVSRLTNEMGCKDVKSYEKYQDLVAKGRTK